MLEMLQRDLGTSANGNAQQYLAQVINRMTAMVNAGGTINVPIVAADNRITGQNYLTTGEARKEFYNDCMASYKQGLKEIHERFPMLSSMGVYIRGQIHSEVPMKSHSHKRSKSKSK